MAVPRPQPLLEIESSNKLTETNDSTLKSHNTRAEIHSQLPAVFCAHKFLFFALKFKKILEQLLYEIHAVQAADSVILGSAQIPVLSPVNLGKAENKISMGWIIPSLPTLGQAGRVY